MRAFVALPLPKELHAKVRELQERIEMTDADIKFVGADELHYNLKFLGEITAEQVERVKAVLDEVVSQFEAFTLHAAGFGAFPSTQYARVVWIGATAGSQELKAMAELLDLKLSEIGFKKEERAFEPHLTVGRVRSARNKPELLILLRELQNADMGSFEARRVILFESKLGPEGPTYSPIHTAWLRERR
jgi:2'-5' RNA ligase